MQAKTLNLFQNNSRGKKHASKSTCKIALQPTAKEIVKYKHDVHDRSMILVRDSVQYRGGERRGLGPRNDVLTTCKAVTLREGQRIIAAFFPQ